MPVFPAIPMNVFLAQHVGILDWIRDELHRDPETVSEVLIERDVQEGEPENRWRTYTPVSHIRCSVTFADKTCVERTEHKYHALWREQKEGTSMNIDKQYKGRVRIEGKPDDMHGYQLSVKDADTGEEISNVKSVVLRMGVGTGDEGVNRATLTYYKHDEHGLFVINERRKVAMETVTVSDPEIAVTAYEVEGTTQYRHEQVRKFVESEYPGYRVLSIQERANSLFETPLHGLAVPPPDRVLTRCDVEFEVVADSDPLGIPLPRIQEHHLIVNVSTSADGSLCIGRETRIRTAPERILDV